MKTKTLIVLMLLPMIVNAVGVGGSCTWQSNCDSSLLCWGTQRGIFTCHNSEALKGNYVPSPLYNPCYGILQVAYIGAYPSAYYVCGECQKGQYTNAAQDYDTETNYDRPTDAYCRNGGYNCTCNMKTGDNWNPYPSWNHNDNQCNACDDTDLGNTECWPNLQCIQTTNGKVCLNSGKNCCQNSDCSTGYSCSDNICSPYTPGAPTTTVTTITSTTLLYDQQCHTDNDCMPMQFCETGYDPYNRCRDKFYSYDTQPQFSYCHRNHECLSGICSTNLINADSGDYPVYVNGAPYPLVNSLGNCIPSVYMITATISPPVISYNSTLSLFAVAKKNGQPQKLYSCEYFINTIQVDYENATGNTTSWAYTTEGNDGFTHHSMIYTPTSQSIYNYKNVYPILVNQSISLGTYDIFVRCFDSLGSYGATKVYTNLVNTNSTTIFNVDLPSTITYNNIYQAQLQYKTFLGVGLDDATCLIKLQSNNVNLTMIPSLSLIYSITLNFNQAGDQKIEVWCSKVGYERAYYTTSVFVENPSCLNNIQDNGETGVDCGGPCSPCDINKKSNGDSCTLDSQCLSDYCGDGVCADRLVPTECADANYTMNTCSIDGSRYCILDTMKCVYNNCTTSADCYSVYYRTSNNLYISYPTTCDISDRLCKIAGQDTTNGTTNALGMLITPLSEVTAVVNGKLYNTFNCQDGTNGFNIITKDKTIVWYKIDPTLETPSIGVMTQTKQFGEAGTINKTALIPELCASVNGQGGIPSNSHSGFATIQFYSSANKQTINQTVNTITYRKNLKNSLTFNIVSSVVGTQMYAVNATNRSILASAKVGFTDSYTNLTSNYTNNILFNLTALSQHQGITGTRIYYKVTSLYGEEVEGETGSFAWWMFAEYDPESPYGIKWNITVQPWHIYILLALIVVGLVYANYRLQENRRQRLGGV